jgi:hypothetical protein
MADSAMAMYFPVEMRGENTPGELDAAIREWSKVAALVPKFRRNCGASPELRHSGRQPLGRRVRDDQNVLALDAERHVWVLGGSDFVVDGCRQRVPIGPRLVLP